MTLDERLSFAREKINAGLLLHFDFFCYRYSQRNIKKKPKDSQVPEESQPPAIAMTSTMNFPQQNLHIMGPIHTISMVSGPTSSIPQTTGQQTAQNISSVSIRPQNLTLHGRFNPAAKMARSQTFGWSPRLASHGTITPPQYSASSTASYAYLENTGDLESVLESVGTYEEPNVTEGLQSQSNNVIQSPDSESQQNSVYEKLRWEYIE